MVGWKEQPSLLASRQPPPPHPTPAHLACSPYPQAPPATFAYNSCLIPYLQATPLIRHTSKPLAQKVFSELVSLEISLISTYCCCRLKNKNKNLIHNILSLSTASGPQRSSQGSIIHCVFYIKHFGQFLFPPKSSYFLNCLLLQGRKLNFYLKDLCLKPASTLTRWQLIWASVKARKTS